ncbi:unnamed protein product, partial [marine sediment metagenome]
GCGQIPSVLYERYITGDTSTMISYGVQWHAQTFTVGNIGNNEDHKITHVKLKLYKVGSPGAMTIGIRLTDGEGKPTGNDLCSVDHAGNSLPSSAAWVDFAFPSPAVLFADTQYAIVLRTASGDAGNAVRWRVDITSPTYAGGTECGSGDSGGSWDAYPGNDFMFEEYGYPVGMTDGTYHAYNTSWVDTNKTKYWISFNVTDGIDWCNETYHFTTIDAETRNPYQIFDFYFDCANETTRQPTNIFDYYFNCSNKSVRA